MNKFLRVLFVLVIIAMSGAIVFQLFFPSIGLDHWWAWDWDQSFICLSQLSFASKCYWSF